MMYFAGIDGGATKTTCVICDSKGRRVGEGVAESSNLHNVGLERALLNIRTSVESARRSANLSPEEIGVACLGLAGLDSRLDFELIRRGVNSSLIAQKCVVVHDGTSALYGAFAGRRGVVVVAGTGSVVVAFDSRGKVVRVGGWGFLMGDEGSAFEIGRKILSASLRAYEERGPETQLLGKLLARFGLSRPEELMNLVYTIPVPVSKIAALAGLATDAALGGDAVSRSILSEAGEALGDMVIALARRSHIISRRLEIATIGGVFKAGDLVLAPFLNRVRAANKDAVIVRPELSPALGTLLIALKSGHVRITPRVLLTLKRSGKRKIRGP